MKKEKIFLSKPKKKQEFFITMLSNKLVDSKERDLVEEGIPLFLANIAKVNKTSITILLPKGTNVLAELWTLLVEMFSTVASQEDLLLVSKTLLPQENKKAGLTKKQREMKAQGIPFFLTPFVQMNQNSLSLSVPRGLHGAKHFLELWILLVKKYPLYVKDGQIVHFYDPMSEQ